MFCPVREIEIIEAGSEGEHCAAKERNQATRFGKAVRPCTSDRGNILRAETVSRSVGKKGSACRQAMMGIAADNAKPEDRGRSRSTKNVGSTYWEEML